jgi:hypothetical protein
VLFVYTRRDPGDLLLNQMPARALLHLVLSVALLAPAVAQAETDFGRLNRQGEEAYQAEHYPEAADLLQQAYAIKPVPALLFNIARAYERSGNDEQAIRFYQRYLDAQDTDAETVKKSARALDLLRTKQAQRQIDEAKAAADKAAADKAAADQAAAKAAEEQAAKQKAATGQQVAPQPAPAPVVVTSPPVQPQRSFVPGVVTLGVGVVTLGVGVGFGVSASNQESAFNRTFDPVQRPALRQTAQNQAHIADVCYAGGSVVSALGVFLVARAIPSAPSAAVPSASLLPGGATLAWGGSW